LALSWIWGEKKNKKKIHFESAATRQTLFFFAWVETQLGKNLNFIKKKFERLGF